MLGDAVHQNAAQAAPHSKARYPRTTALRLRTRLNSLFLLTSMKVDGGGWKVALAGEEEVEAAGGGGGKLGWEEERGRWVCGDGGRGVI